ncbi:MAG: sensor domain-containing protein [Acidimicrobiia bacterium]|nr:sensor domain-containing protein [Acidimicrobiia bacterium]
MLTTLLSPWRDRRTWFALVQLATTLPMATASFTAMIALLATSAALLIVLPLALPVAWILFFVAHLLADIERSRLAALAGLDLADPVPTSTASGRFLWLRRLAERAQSGARWKEIGYLILIFPVGMFLGTATVVAWSGSVALIFLPAYMGALPGDTARFGLFDVGMGPAVVIASLLGMLGLVLLAPCVTWTAAGLHRRMAAAFLGPDRGAELGAQVERLESSRVAAVDSARPNDAASSATCTTGPSSGSSPSPCSSAPPRSASNTIQRVAAPWWPTPTTRRRRRWSSCATWCAASTP